MRRPAAASKSAILALAAALFAGCSGGAGPGSVPAATPSQPALTGGQSLATVTFRAVIPPKVQATSSIGRKPSYVAPTALTLTIRISNTGNSHLTTVTAQKQCGATGCFFSATASVPVLATAYLFSVTETGTSGRPLGSANVTQTLIPGANSVTLTLAPIVDHAAVTVSGALTFGGSGTQTLPITAQTFDADGNAIPNGLTYAAEFAINLFEVDPLSAFSLVPTTSTPAPSADCSLLTPQTCSLRSNEDSISVAFNPTANAFPTEPSYYPEEAIVDAAGNAGANITAANSTAVASPKCTPAPVCVYAEPFYPLLLAAGTISGAQSLQFNPLLALTSGSTIYTDTGTITGAGTSSYAFNVPTGGTNLSSQFPSGVLYVPATGNDYTVDYSGTTAPDGNQDIDLVSPSAVYTTTEYGPDPNFSFSGLGNGDDIILGPDGDLWWIDPLTGDLRYANPSTPGSAAVCQLNPPSGSLFLAAFQIVATPPGVSPSRIWFSAFDTAGLTNSYLGYVNVAGGSNSCGSGQAGHYVQISNSGIPATPDGMAVDGTGTMWFNSGNPIAQNYTSIGQGTVNGSGGVTLTPPVTLPGAMGQANQAWDILYNAHDGYLYTAVDGGYIGRFLPSAGVASATAYVLPLPVASLMGDLTGNDNDDPSYCPSSLFSASCFPQFSWDPGAGGPHGQLTLVVTSGSTGTSIANSVVQVNLDYAGVTFAADARSRLPARYRAPRSHHRLLRRRRYGVTTMTPRNELGLLYSGSSPK